MNFGGCSSSPGGGALSVHIRFITRTYEINRHTVPEAVGSTRSMRHDSSGSQKLTLSAAQTWATNGGMDVIYQFRGRCPPVES